MTKSSKGKGFRLIDEASRILGRDLKLALEESDANLTIRRAQEARFVLETIEKHFQTV